MCDCAIEKQLDEESFEGEVYPIESTDMEEDQLILSVRQSVKRINCHEIFFLESRGHNVYVYTGMTEVRVYQKLSDVFRKLPVYFHQCHKSYVVNFERVARVAKTQFLMADGRIVPISRNRRMETKEAYLFFKKLRAKQAEIENESID